VTLVIDAAPLVALADRQEPRRDAIPDVLRAERRRMFVAAAVTSEIDYLLDQRFGPAARRAFLEELAAGRYDSPALDSTDYGMALDLDRRYADLNLGLADLSVIVFAHRLGTRRIVTFDQRHFRTVGPIQEGAFAVLPADQ
jgi:predicted nucleic acid-binding protein